MGFFSDFFSRAGRVVRGQTNRSMDAVESLTFESTLKQTVRDMKTELNKVVKSSAEAMSHYNRGGARGTLGLHNEAIEDYSTATALLRCG